MTVEKDMGGGQGGPPGRLGTESDLVTGDSFRPPSIIYGLSDPSADLIIQEIRLRTSSLAEIRHALAADQDRIARIPAAWPVLSAKSRMISGFGYRRDPFTPTVRHHDGVDISAPYGSVVVATGRGLVVFSGYEKYLGHTVRVDHGDGYTSVYAHLSKRLVEVGDTVNRGDELGRTGSSGRSSGPHLHYEIRLNGKSIDPEQFLPVRGNL